MTDGKDGIFGIDLGTTYSVVAFIDDTGRASVTRNRDGDDTTPSVVYFENESNIVVGEVAKKAAAQDPENVVSLIKREMGDKDYLRIFHGKGYTAPAISAIILSALAESPEFGGGERVTRAVITVPAYFGLLERDATKKAGEIAGIEVIGIVPEPVAAALQYGVLGSGDDTTVLVFDLGGGTFDISIMKLGAEKIEVLTTDGNHRLGGADWDETLHKFLVNEIVAQTGNESVRDDEEALGELKITAEDAKTEISSRESTTVNFRYEGTPAKIEISRTQFEQMTKELLDETIRITQRALDTGESLYPGLKNSISEVLLVGGATWMPAVKRRLEEEFGWTPKLADPDLAVAKGAALYAAAQTVKIVQRELDQQEGKPEIALDETSPSPEAIQMVSGSTGIREADLEKIATKQTVNVLPKAIGVKLIDTKHPWYRPDMNDFDQVSYVEHLVEANTQLPYKAPHFVAHTVLDGQSAIEIQLWEQAGATKSRELAENTLVDHGPKEISGIPNLPSGSPVEIDLSVDNEGLVAVQAVEPTSGSRLEFTAQISILSQEQVDQAKQLHSGLTIKT